MKDSTAWFVTEAARSQVGALYEHVFARIASGQSRHLVCPASDAQRSRIALGAHRTENVGSPQNLAIADSPASAATASRGAARPQGCDTPSHVGGRSIALEIVVAVDAGLHERSFVTMPPASCRESSRFLERFVRDAASSYWHQTCTAKMGRYAMAVIDAQLNVYGIDGLRIADGSIMPRVTTGNTMAPCVVIGERAAHLIGREHGL